MLGIAPFAELASIVVSTCIRIFFAKAKDVPIADLLADMDPEEGWGFGHMFKDLTPEERDRLEGTAKNFGQLKKEAKAKTGHPGKGPKNRN